MVLPLGDVEKPRIVPFATYVLIAINVVMYVVQLQEGRQFTVAYAATPYEITHNTDLPQPVAVGLPGDRNLPGFPVRVVVGPRVIDHAPGPYPIWLTLFTAMFLHGSPLHLAG